MKSIIVFIDSETFNALLVNNEYEEFLTIDGEESISYKVIDSIIGVIKSFNHITYIDFNQVESDSDCVFILNDAFSGNFQFLNNSEFKMLHHNKTLNYRHFSDLQKLEGFSGMFPQPQPEDNNTLYNTIAQGIASSNLNFDTIWNAIPDFDKKKAERELISSKAKNKNLTLEDVNTESYKPYVRNFLEEVKSLDIFGTEFTCKLDYLLKTLEQIS